MFETLINALYLTELNNLGSLPSLEGLFHCMRKSIIDRNFNIKKDNNKLRVELIKADMNN